jgi:Common central domain of tyrosinase
MGVRKNAKFLSPAEKENFVKACVLMKAQIVNPAAPPAQRYSKWDEYVAVHWMIQDAFAPGDSFVNFGHGGSGSYSFLSWHRYFLFQFEKDLQALVPGVMLPYWDWTDPSSIMTDTFMGPDGTTASEVRSGYFAANAPGTAGNVTPAPVWWPAGLTGWILPAAFADGSGALRRGLDAVSQLPTANDLRNTLAKGTYPSFQNALESGNGLPTFPSQQMHNGLHGWLGGAFGQMSDPSYSPFDPLFYLHHCNIDRLWAMWQMDGHASEYPSTGGQDNHRRNDIMYPWTGGTAGYGTNAAISSSIPMPNFNAVGIKRNVDTLDFRTAFGYTYDTLAIIGIGLDRTGSMLGMTPDPMVTAAPDVTKWEAAKRGVSAFLQDCETVQNSGTTYVMAGIKTFRRLAANEFTAVFPAPGYGLIKSGTTFSRSAFDTAVAGLMPGGGTPLADALVDVRNTIVEPPFGHAPADERRYLAMLTDGLLTAGAPMSSIPNGSFANTAVFAMGFGTGADVDYATLASMVAKGVTLTTQQVFHGENAGTIDKFYSNALAAAIGFTSVIDPVIELFAGEHAHIDFHVTSADDTFLITVQGVDFDDDNWTYHLHGPGGYMAYGDGGGHDHSAGHGCHCACRPDVTATRARARLSLVLQRDNADASCWVGKWRLMIAYKARRLDAMVMPSIGDLIVPVSAGPVRGARFARLLQAPKERIATRNIAAVPANRLDRRPVSANQNDQEACNAVVNIYSRTRLRLELAPPSKLLEAGTALAINVNADVLQGSVTTSRSLARLLAPARDVAPVIATFRDRIPREARLVGAESEFDAARLLAVAEKRDANLARPRDEELKVAVHEGGPMHVHVEKTDFSGVYHVGVYIDGSYYPGYTPAGSGHDPGGSGSHGTHVASAAPAAPGGERFIRILSTMVGVPPKGSVTEAPQPQPRRTPRRRSRTTSRRRR